MITVRSEERVPIGRMLSELCWCEGVNNHRSDLLAVALPVILNESYELVVNDDGPSTRSSETFIIYIEWALRVFMPRAS
jgi:hypothetical protein